MITDMLMATRTGVERRVDTQGQHDSSLPCILVGGAEPCQKPEQGTTRIFQFLLPNDQGTIFGSNRPTEQQHQRPSQNPFLLLVKQQVLYSNRTMPGLPWLLFQGAFKMTAKGAAITFSSTVFSCTLACYIEIGAHRLVYHYFPHKYANVEYANGLTQEQLDAVRIHHVEQPQVLTRTTPQEDLEKRPQNTVIDLRPFSRDGFWKEEEKRSEPPSLLALTQLALPSNDIMACAMTG